MNRNSEGNYDQEVQDFISDLKHNKICGSFDTAMHTVHLLRRLVGSNHWRNAKELIGSIETFWKQILETDSSEMAIGNMVRRVLKLIREEYSGTVGNLCEGSSVESLQNILMAKNHLPDDFSKPTQGLKSVVIDSINELISELENCHENIAMQALEYIHSNEIIMTLGYSRTVEKFLKNAARKRKFSVIVAECAPFFNGQELAMCLVENNIEITVIPDSAIFAVMSRVNKVIIGTHIIMADGGLLAANGAQTIALAAKHHAVPFIVCAGLFKLSPGFACSHVQDNTNNFPSPNIVMKFKEENISSNVDVLNPVFDYITADLVKLFISDTGGNSPSYLYRLLAEMYHQQDYSLCQ